MRPDLAGHRAAAAPRRRSFTAVAVILLVGIAWMHTLGNAPLPQSPAAMVAVSTAQPDTSAGMAAAMTAGAGEQHGCDGRGHGPCPGTGPPGGHASSMCQAPALGGAAFTAPHRPPAGAAPMIAAVRLLVTAAVEAAGGTGCGPPSLSMLSISRT